MGTRLYQGRLARACVLAIAAVIAAMLGACGELLPRSEVQVKTTWSTFDEAKAAFDRVEPNRTTGAELRAAGLDPYANSNVELLNYSDILRRFPVAGATAKLDPGLQQCMDAGKACLGYSVDMRELQRERTGPFLLDVFGFRRDTKTTGWTFSAIVLLVDDRVVYALYGGKPVIAESEKTIEPLGPLQNWSGSGVIR